jgi:hypothetical protein
MQVSTALLRFVQQNWLGLLILGALVFAFVFLRSPATRVGSTQELDALLADGAPKVVEFYSDF